MAKKHIREIIQGWKALGCEVGRVSKSGGHPIFEVTMPNGITKRVPVAGSPKNTHFTVTNAIKQIQDAIDGRDINV